MTDDKRHKTKHLDRFEEDSENSYFPTSVSASTTETNAQVYVLNLPLDLTENDVEKTIRSRMKKVLRMDVVNVRCFAKLGIAMIQLMNEDDKEHLIENVQSMVLYAERNITISFVDKIERDTYIVIDSQPTTLPSTEEILKSYRKTYDIDEERVCEVVSAQFPNIFRIHSLTFDELGNTADEPNFIIDTNLATIYPRSDCCFFENLPSNVTKKKIFSAIAAQIGEDELSPTLFHIEYDKVSSTAAVIASQLVQKWIKAEHLTIKEQDIPKTTKLAYRVIVAPVPSGFDLRQILMSKIFSGEIIGHKTIDDKLILELKTIDSYNHCLQIGAFRIGNATMNIDPISATVASDDNDLNDNNWYEGEMLNMKPDITTVMNNHEHPIFRYNWNAKNWSQQFEKAKGGDKQPNNKFDLQRHLLRVTVMLNTIDVLRKGNYFIDGQEIKLNVRKLQTISYDHKSTLIIGRNIHESELRAPCRSTKVKVLNEDCLVLYEQLVAEGHRPLLLNMANAKKPGGGYRKGDDAQEENLFRRSDYYHSLDAELADPSRAERFIRTSNCDLKEAAKNDTLYPMEDFGAIYTSGITVFRQTEENGYAFMKNRMRNVCSIAMAAYRDPPLANTELLENKAAVNTRKKIENVFAIAHYHKHDSLILSAFGCGAFKNPPKHIALLFKSVIHQYAGYFEKIYFAIVDDHNTGNKMNPHGNFSPFAAELDDLVVESSKSFRNNSVSGPYRILNRSPDGLLTIDDTRILSLSPCQHGAKCQELNNSQHNSSFAHPPVCPLQTTTTACDEMNDEIHMFYFIHSNECKHGGQCESNDPKHLKEFSHPDYCKDGSHCFNISPEHLFTYRHLPLCRDGVTCPKHIKGDADHEKLFRHVKSMCTRDNTCAYFHDKEHFKNTIHTFREPCPFTPHNCRMYVQFIQSNGQTGLPPSVEQHCYTFSHVCPYGRQCKTTDNKHFEISIHVSRQLCPHGDKCKKLEDEDHLESFTHPGIRDIRYFCKEPGHNCKHRHDNQHLTKYRHGKNYNQLSIAPSRNLNARVNFVRNQERMIQNVNTYMERQKWKKAKTSPDILNWIRGLQPVHRCGQMIFESILVHGHVMSRNYMKALENPRNVAKAVLQHSRIRRIFLQHNTTAVKEAALAFIKGLVDTEYAKSGTEGKSLAKLDADHEENININRTKLQSSISDADLNAIRTWTIKIAQASIQIVNNPMGIGYEVDRVMETDKHVFSILGPHCGHYYGDIVVLFKQEILLHPDTNFSAQAATRFHSAKIYPDRPWVQDRGSENTRVDDFFSAKLHCSVPRFEYAAAAELIASTGLAKKSANVSLDDIIQRWVEVDSHETFECHLPQLIPLDYVDRVYIPKNIFEALSSESKQSARGAFGDSLIVTHHLLDLSVVRPGGMVSLDPTREIYRSYIVDQIKEQIKKRAKTSQISQGIIITIPSSQFGQHVALPMSIHQSYELYQLDKPSAPNHPEFAYIYWKAMHGDMMITIANEKIDMRKEQQNLRCLVCYVAESPSMATEDYHEAYSYINDGLPFEHDKNVGEARFRAKSNTFYRGCNIDDFFTFCLKIIYKTNEVSLSHAGPNGIYNHQKIKYQFDRSRLDLSRIEYVHISAGKRDVPIRNFMIHHEKVAEYHPTFDDKFQVDTSELQGKCRTAIEYRPAPKYSGGAPASNNNNVQSNQYLSQRSVTDLQPKSQPQPVKKEEKSSVFKRMKNVLFGSSDKPELSSSQAQTEQYKPSPPSTPKAQPSVRNTPSSRLSPCEDSIYCLNQNSRDHTDRYSHPCRFNELCRNVASEPHLVHEKHNVPQCPDDRDCMDKTDPVHRAKYRHAGLPDYLFPCRRQEACYDRSVEHRIKFSHGEEIPSFKSKTEIV